MQEGLIKRLRFLQMSRRIVLLKNTVLEIELKK